MFKKIVVAVVLSLVASSAMAWPFVQLHTPQDNVIQGAKDEVENKATYATGVFEGHLDHRNYITAYMNCSNPPARNTKPGMMYQEVARTLERSTVDMSGWYTGQIVEYAFDKTYDCKY